MPYCPVLLPHGAVYHITKIMCNNKGLHFKNIKYLALKADKITGIIFHLYKINVLIDNTGYKDYNKQRIYYNIIFVMLYSFKSSKYGLFYIYKNVNNINTQSYSPPGTSPILSSSLWCSVLVAFIYPLVVSILLCPSTSASFAISFPAA